MSRLNWTSSRQGPGDFDDTAPSTPSYAFDHTRNTHGGDSWPTGFGPSVISKAWKNGLVVVAELERLPHPVAVTESRWAKGTKVLEVKTQGSWLVPDRVYTRDSVAGLMSTGEVVDK